MIFMGRIQLRSHHTNPMKLEKFHSASHGVQNSRHPDTGVKLGIKVLNAPCSSILRPSFGQFLEDLGLEKSWTQHGHADIHFFRISTTRLLAFLFNPKRLCLPQPSISISQQSLGPRRLFFRGVPLIPLSLTSFIHHHPQRSAFALAPVAFPQGRRAQQGRQALLLGQHQLRVDLLHLGKHTKDPGLVVLGKIHKKSL